MLAWIAVLMIGGFLVGCGVVIGASCYQLIKVIRTPKQPKRLPQIVEA